jgi:cell division protease FtsH
MSIKITPKSDPNQMEPKNKNQNNFLIFFASLVLIFLILSFFKPELEPAQNKNIKDFTTLVSDVRSKKISKLTLSKTKDKFKAEVFQDPNNADRSKVDAIEYKIQPLTPTKSAIELINSSLTDQEKLQVGFEKGQIIYSEEEKNALESFVSGSDFWTFLLILSSLGIGVIFIKKIAENNSKAISFGNSKAKLYDINQKDKITFADVAGNEEVKTELLEVVDFLKRPQAYTDMGAKIPRGVLLIGDPGNGKTLMAKAVAGEAGVPFLYVSGSEFVEMFVGVGASRVRDLFKYAKKKAPCVIFIDEIDAVGRKRGQGSGGGNDEREQTLNQFLVEMDGFEGNESVIVLAATNRPDVLDRALLRPGRFDRQVTVTSPDVKERKLILEVHAKNKKMDPNIDFGLIAKRTSGFSGADLMNVLNEGAILTVRFGKKLIDSETLREAIEKVMLGPSLITKVVTDEQKKHTAFHEAGHAIAATVLPRAQKVSKITIVPRGKAAGYTFNAEDENDPQTRTKQEFLSQIVVLFGGYTVEESVFSDVSTGASNDLAKATEIARNMVTKYGMSNLGPISLSESSMSYNSVSGTTEYGTAMGDNIDKEVQGILASCQKVCREIVKKYMPQIEEITNYLILNETIEVEEFENISNPIKNSYSVKFDY